MMLTPVKKCLFAMGTGLLALALAACSQQSAPEEALDPASPVAEEAKAEKAEKAEKKVKPAPQRRKPAPKAKAAAEAPAPADPTSLSQLPAAPQPTFRPVEMTGPFIPSAPGKRIAHVNVPGPYVAVTFDDGPHSTLTPQVLDIFNRHGAHATFFVLGRNANRNRSLLARAAAQGHEIGAHTWSHINMRATGRDKIVDELTRTNDVIAAATGSYPKVMRPPYGSVNRELVDMVYQRFGTPSILWDVDTNDWRKPGRQAVINRAVGKARPGSIILLHDIHPSTVDCVEDIVTGLQARGFKLVTVSELISMGRRAAGAAAPAGEAEVATTPAAAPAPASVEPSPLPAQQQQQLPLPEGAATLGGSPLPPAVPVAAPAANDDFDFFES